MNKYFLIRPSEFWKYDDVDIEGNYPQVSIDDFRANEDEMLDPKFNFLFFEVPCRESKGKNKKVRFGNEATEIFSNSKFNVEVTRNPETGEDEVYLYSDELGLYLRDNLVLNEVLTKNSKISGLINYMKENEELFKTYSYNLDAVIESARFYKERHDETLYGPSKNSKRELRKGFTRNIRY